MAARFGYATDQDRADYKARGKRLARQALGRKIKREAPPIVAVGVIGAGFIFLMRKLKEKGVLK